MAAYDPLTIAGVIGRWAVEKPDLTVLTVEGAGVRDDETRTYAAAVGQGPARSPPDCAGSGCSPATWSARCSPITPSSST